jgi:hypothetical protein
MMTNDLDLVYDGRTRKRSPGASDLTQRIWLLLKDHPEGMTRDQIHAELRVAGWLDTDVYRSYQQELTYSRYHRSLEKGLVGDQMPSNLLLNDDQEHPINYLEYGSEEFKLRAQLWWIRKKLQDMARTKRVYRTNYTCTQHHKHHRYCTAKTARWFANTPPRIIDYSQGNLVELSTTKHSEDQKITEAHVQRERVVARLLEDLNETYPGRSPVRDRLLESIQIAYDYIKGRNITR